MTFTTCAMVKSRYIGDGHTTFNRNPYNGYINPYYWVDDHPLFYGNNESLDTGTNGIKANFNIKMIHLGGKCCMVGSPPNQKQSSPVLVYL